jgi:phosphate butyryltransferase
MMATTMKDLHDRARRGTPRTIAVAWPHDEDVLLSLDRAAGHGLVRPLLAGRRRVVEEIVARLGLKNIDADFIESETDADAVEAAVRSVRAGRAHMLMKGLVSTSTFLRGILNKEWGLRKRALLSHLAVFEARDPTRLVLFTDVAMNIAPDLAAKVQIIENAVEFAHRLGIPQPRVAAIAAVETVSADMPATIDAAVLAKMCDRGQIKGCVVDGPLALDNALSAEAARHKGITSPAAGCADILLVPDIEAGNVLYKAVGMLSSCALAAVILGATAPVVLTSRADSDETKFNSIALAAAVSDEAAVMV